MSVESAHESVASFWRRATLRRAPSASESAGKCMAQIAKTQTLGIDIGKDFMLPNLLRVRFVSRPIRPGNIGGMFSLQAREKNSKRNNDALHPVGLSSRR